MTFKHASVLNTLLQASYQVGYLCEKKKKKTSYNSWGINKTTCTWNSEKCAGFRSTQENPANPPVKYIIWLRIKDILNQSQPVKWLSSCISLLTSVIAVSRYCLSITQMSDILSKNSGFVNRQNWQQKEWMFNCIKGLFLKHEGSKYVVGSSVCTDSAPVMLGKNSGSVSNAKNEIPDVLVYHRMLHRWALMVNTSPKNLKNMLSNRVQTVK